MKAIRGTAPGMYLMEKKKKVRNYTKQIEPGNNSRMYNVLNLLEGG